MKVFVIALSLFVCAFAYAQPGCCSRHGGVAGCDPQTGHQSCQDGTDSPSCMC